MSTVDSLVLPNNSVKDNFDKNCNAINLLLGIFNCFNFASDVDQMRNGDFGPYLSYYNQWI